MWLDLSVLSFDGIKIWQYTYFSVRGLHQTSRDKKKIKNETKGIARNWFWKDSSFEERFFHFRWNRSLKSPTCPIVTFTSHVLSLFPNTHEHEHFINSVEGKGMISQCERIWHFWHFSPWVHETLMHFISPQSVVWVVQSHHLRSANNGVIINCERRTPTP